MSIHSMTFAAALTAQIQEHSYGFWIGFHKGTENAMNWVWTDNGDTSYQHWHQGNPENNKVL